MNLATLADAPASILPQDETFFRKVGLKPYHRVPSLIERHVGTLHSEDHEIDVHVTPGPLTCWRIQVTDLTTGEVTEMKTGTGPLTNFWPAVDLIAQRAIAISPAKSIAKILRLPRLAAVG